MTAWVLSGPERCLIYKLNKDIFTSVAMVVKNRRYVTVTACRVSKENKCFLFNQKTANMFELKLLQITDFFLE